jgi:uncharacterized protein (DUF952 family)
MRFMELNVPRVCAGTSAYNSNEKGNAMILHITSSAEWEKARAHGEYAAPSLVTEGFIHCSTPAQAADTANLFFRGQRGLVLLCIDETRLRSECRYEAPTGGGKHDPGVGTLFPHVYGPINLSAVVNVVDFPADEHGVFSLPAVPAP